ncbi:MAG: protocatechuate 3,4-dioxygenase subunit alpha [Actinomycetota bacterium]
MDRTPIPSQTAGPYFHLGCTEHHSVGCLVGPETKGERIRLVCRVLDGEGAPVPDAMIEIWQANAAGKYNHPEDTQDRQLESGFIGFGRLATDERGVCEFTTIKPGRVAGSNGVLQASHINVSVFARGILRRLATRIYFTGDPETSNDPVLALVPQERKATLMATRRGSRADEWHFDIHLCGEHETVFFDV